MNFFHLNLVAKIVYTQCKVNPTECGVCEYFKHNTWKYRLIIVQKYILDTS